MSNLSKKQKNDELLLTFPEAQIVYTDFHGNGYSGTGSSFTTASIGIRIDGRRASTYRKAGWNVKEMVRKNKKVCFIPVSMYVPATSSLKPRFRQQIHIIIDGYEPKRVNEFEGQELFRLMDYVYIKKAFISIIGYHWNANYPYKREGIKAYLKTGAFVIDRYADAAKMLRMKKEKISNVQDTTD